MERRRFSLLHGKEKGKEKGKEEGKEGKKRACLGYADLLDNILFPILFLPDKECPTKRPLSNLLDTNIPIHTVERGVCLTLHHFMQTKFTFYNWSVMSVVMQDGCTFNTTCSACLVQVLERGKKLLKAQYVQTQD